MDTSVQPGKVIETGLKTGKVVNALQPGKVVETGVQPVKLVETSL